MLSHYQTPLAVNIFLAICVASTTQGATAKPNTVVEADLVVYGGTSGGVVAAVQAARLGRTVVIVEPGRHLGGMTSGGLSWTDVGSSSDRIRAIGGLAREFYARIGAHYGMAPGTEFGPPRSDDPLRPGVDFAKPPSLSFEPNVAEAVFKQRVDEAGVAVHFEQRLAEVRKDGVRIHEIVTSSRTAYHGRFFIDATYEGDLLAAAGVSFAVGRESNHLYGETLNGVQGPATNPRAGKFEVIVDPYEIPGDPSSGLVPYLLQDEPWGELGAADHRVQSYNYRVCLKDRPDNRLPIEPPANYDAANYELLARWSEARAAAGVRLTLRSFLKYDPLQNGKYDFNNRCPISTDFIGGAHAYPEANFEEREQIANAHEDYLRGLFHFLVNSPRIPLAVREEISQFGLCRDEFTDNASWPHQLYVREARRMVSEFVMTEHHCRGEQVAAMPIGLGTYGIDIHAVRRVVVNGLPVNEGSNCAGTPRPYPIGYGAIVPRRQECDNLIVTFALSASHVAFGSIRMESALMALSQSAAIAAHRAIDAGAAVQNVDYADLKRHLLSARQLLGGR